MEQSGLAPNSSEQKIVDSVAVQVAPLVRSMYGVPFRFFVTKQKEPNAYEYYGPRIYVSRGMVDYMDYSEELAGVLCHEASHVIHHDGFRSIKANDRGNARAKALVMRAELLTRRHLRHPIEVLAAWGNNLAQLGYTRAQEEDADKLGATVCSQAHINPWGLVAILKKMSKNRAMHIGGLGVWLHSDHPTYRARVAALQNHWLKNPEFSQWTRDMALTRLRHPTP